MAVIPSEGFRPGSRLARLWNRSSSFVIGTALGWGNLPTIVLAVSVAVPLGVLAAARHGGWLDRLLNRF